VVDVRMDDEGKLTISPAVEGYWAMIFKVWEKEKPEIIIEFENI
jgi:hypothetical protein